MNEFFEELFEHLPHVISSGLADKGAIHPIVVHFPVALLCIVPVFIVLGLTLKNSAKNFYICALILMLIGTISIFYATSTGSAAAEILETTDPAIVHTLDEHIELGEQARLNFSFLSVIFFIYVVFLTQKFNRKINTAAVCGFLIFYAVCLLMLLNAAHYGGKLVHHHGIQSPLYTEEDHH